jgi:hypothetical protein
MYCTYCNHPNAEENKFCENCGKPLLRAPVAPSPAQKVSQPVSPVVSEPETARPAKTSWARRFASIGSAIVVYCFFLPWILVSCSLDVENRSGIQISGFEIASGNYKISEDLNQYATWFGGSPYEPSSNVNYASPLLALIPIVGAIGLISLNGRISGSIAAILSGILGIGGMAVFTVVALAYGNELAQSLLLKMQFRAGYWGTWLGFIWLLLIAIVTIRQRR